MNAHSQSASRRRIEDNLIATWVDVAVAVESKKRRDKKGFRMLLTLKLLSNNLYLGSPMRFEHIGDNQNVPVTLRSPETDEHEQGVDGYQTVCEASANLTPDEHALETFEALWERKIPSGVDLSYVADHIRSSWTPGYFQNYEIPLSRLCFTIAGDTWPIWAMIVRSGRPAFGHCRDGCNPHATFA